MTTCSVVGRRPERSVREPPYDRVARDALAAAAGAPVAVGLDAARDHRPIRLDPLLDRAEPEPIQASE